MITISINGDPRQFNAQLTISALIVELELTGKRIAIERNGDIVPRSLHASTPVENGDQFEIVVAVGGG